jgi:urate oxidase
MDFNNVNTLVTDGDNNYAVCEDFDKNTMYSQAQQINFAG